MHLATGDVVVLRVLLTNGNSIRRVRAGLAGAPQFQAGLLGSKFLKGMVGAGRFERPTPCAQGRCATRLRYAPTGGTLVILSHFFNRCNFRVETAVSERYQNRRALTNRIKTLSGYFSRDLEMIEVSLRLSRGPSKKLESLPGNASN
jgi:hypothetical protein